MKRRIDFQLSLTAMLGLVAAFAINFWLFRQGFLYGFIGLNVTKHLVVAWLCRTMKIEEGKELGPKGLIRGSGLEFKPGQVGSMGSGGFPSRT